MTFEASSVRGRPPQGESGKVIQYFFVHSSLIRNATHDSRLHPSHDSVIIPKPVLVILGARKQEDIVFSAHAVLAQNLSENGSEA
jgi:hypothetical protein